ncbi:MAG: penicillin-binding protein 1A [Actinomycetota bacterium]
MILAFLILMFGLPVVAVACTLTAFLLFPPSVTLPQPQAATLAQTSHIYAADGSLLASLHAQYNREPVGLDQMAPVLAKAAVASEDARFYQHAGIDVQGIFRALLADLRAKSVVQGGSTITEQYVKTAYTGDQHSILRKFREALLASQLERTYSKSKILESYLNTIYFGSGAYGAEAASQTYFGKHASQITLTEAATLVGVIPAPEDYSPLTHPANAETRRLIVLDRMLATGAITAGQADEARAHPPKLVSTTNVEVTRFPIFVDAVETYLIGHYGKAKVFSGGLDVTTTVQPGMQAAAEDTLAKALPSPKDPQAALVSVDPATGYVTALAGGRATTTGGFNIPTQGRRQPGSSFKPFVLVAALESGITPQSTYEGPSSICLPGWKPDCHVSNFNNENFSSITLETATIHSVNTVYAQLVLQVGPAKVVDVARRMGIPGPSWLPHRSNCKVTPRDPCTTVLTPLPSIALGSEEATPFEMASAYATLASGGIYREPKLVSMVTDVSGAVLESGPSKGVQAISSQVAFTASSVLSGVITSGTGVAANIGRPAAGKTGTASDFRNAWFVGYTPNLATSVCVGYRDTNQPLLNIHGVSQVAGGTIPAQTWANYMKVVLTGVPPAPFVPVSAASTTSGGGFQLPGLDTPTTQPSGEAPTKPPPKRQPKALQPATQVPPLPSQSPPAKPPPKAQESAHPGGAGG